MVIRSYTDCSGTHNVAIHSKCGPDLYHLYHDNVIWFMSAKTNLLSLLSLELPWMVLPFTFYNGVLKKEMIYETV